MCGLSSIHVNLEHGGHCSFYFLPYPVRLGIQKSGVSAWKEVLFLSLPVLGIIASSFISFPSLYSLPRSFCFGQVKYLRNSSLEGSMHSERPLPCFLWLSVL